MLMSFLFTIATQLQAGYGPVEHTFISKVGRLTLLIRPIQDGDRSYLDQTYGSERAMRTYLGGTVRDQAEIDRRFARYVGWSKTSKEHPWIHALIFLKKADKTLHLREGQFLGGIMVEPDRKRKQSEISYILIPESWSLGVCTAAVEKILEMTLPRLQFFQETDENGEKFEVKRLEATARPDNIGSWRVLEKNHFSKDEQETHVRSTELKEGEAEKAQKRWLYFLPIHD